VSTKKRDRTAEGEREKSQLEGERVYWGGRGENFSQNENIVKMYERFFRRERCEIIERTPTGTERCRVRKLSNESSNIEHLFPHISTEDRGWNGIDPRQGQEWSWFVRRYEGEVMEVGSATVSLFSLVKPSFSCI
jgi:hypothetical protein